MTGGPWLDERQQRAWRSFIAIQGRLQARLARHLQRDSGLSAADYEVLSSLSEASGGRLRAYELGKTTDREKSRLSHHLTRMAQRGLIERQTCSEDTRYADVVLTAAGRTAIEEAAPLHVAHVRDWFVDALTPDQLTALADACDAVLAKLGDAPDDACAVAGDTPCGAATDSAGDRVCGGDPAD